MANVMVNYRIDEDLKNEYEKVCDDMGLSMSAAYMLFVKKVVREGRLPFEVTTQAYDERHKEKQEERDKRLLAYLEKVTEIKAEE